MKKTVLILSCVLLFSGLMTAQQLPNASFEEWEELGSPYEEPVNWSSIKTSDASDFLNQNAPKVLEPSNDARTGQYSIQLTNFDTPLINIVATGTLTCGRIHANVIPDSTWSYTDPTDSRWSVPFPWRPDSLVAWYKYTPVDGDRMKIQALLHVNEGRVPDEGDPPPNWCGYAEWNSPSETVTEWKRFSVAFDYEGYNPATPEHILIMLTSGFGYDAKAGSVALFDDVELIYNDQGIHDVEQGTYNVYSVDQTVYLNDLPSEYYKDAQMDILDMSGRIMWSDVITSPQIRIGNSEITNGIYILRIQSEKHHYTHKLYFR